MWMPNLIDKRVSARPGGLTDLPVLAPIPATGVVSVVAGLDLLLLAGGLFALLANVVPLVAGLALLLACSASLVALGLYRPHRMAETLPQSGRLIVAWGTVSVAAVAFTLVFGRAAWGGGAAPVAALSVAMVAVTAARLGLVAPALRRRYGETLRGARIIVGTGPLAQRVAQAGPRSGLTPPLVGFVDDLDEGRRLSSSLVAEAPFLGGLDRVAGLARERRITHVVVAREDLSRGRLVELAHHWLDEGLQVSLVSSAFEVMVARASGSLIGGVPLAELQQSPQRGWSLRMKRLADILVAGVGGVVLLPLLLGIALSIRLSSPGPVLFRQTRIGRKGKPFTLFKFRSMVANNDDRDHRKYVESLIKGQPTAVDAQGKIVYKLVDDPRITPWGRFLRQTSLDEFPQLWNVLRGDMSLVGPRPCLPYEWDLYEEWQRHRLNVLPGITGLWQVSGRSQVPFEEMVLLDLHYIANWSLNLDLALLVRTIPVVFRGSGGH